MQRKKGQKKKKKNLKNGDFASINFMKEEVVDCCMFFTLRHVRERESGYGGFGRGRIKGLRS